MNRLLVATVAVFASLFACTVPEHKLPPSDAPAVHELGISPGAELLSLSSADLDATLAEMVDAGATWVRVDVPWPAVQSSRSTWDFLDEDRVIDAAIAHGLHVIAVAGYRPSWATTTAGGLDVDAYAAFIGRAVKRYGARVEAWELWNEPNLAGAWGAPADPAEYATALVAAHRAAKDARPRTTVLVGGLAPARDASGNRAPVSFLSGVYDAGGHGSFDAVAIHPYGYPAKPDDGETRSWNTWYRMADIRSLLDDHGDDDATIWITEFGAPTGDADVAVSESRQADILETGIREWRAMTRMGPMFVYSHRDRGTDRLDVEENFGLRRHDGSAKPALQVFVDAARSGG